MPHIHYSITEPYRADQMFLLVNDINAYSLFLPHCIKSGIIKREGNTITAFIEIEKLGIRKRFTTKNTLYAPNEIKIQLVSGPFKSLFGKWQFITLEDNKSEIIFDLHFEFKSKLLEFTFGAIFQDVVHNMVTVFSQRAKKIYSVET